MILDVATDLAIAAGALAVVLFALDRLGLWAESHGWIFWRRRQADMGASGGLFAEMQSLITPSHRHTIAELQARKALPAEQATADPHPIIDLDRKTISLPTRDPE